MDARGAEVAFATGVRERFDGVVWATGYGDRIGWLQIPGSADPRTRRFVEDRGRTAVPGPFHAGRSWQDNRASALLCGADADAAAVVRRVTGHLRAAAG